MLTRQKLENFIARRNASSFATNIQVHIDAEECGFTIDDLGAVTRFRTGWMWQTSCGTVVEDCAADPVWRLDPTPRDEHGDSLID